MCYPTTALRVVAETCLADGPLPTDALSPSCRPCAGHAGELLCDRQTRLWTFLCILALLYACIVRFDSWWDVAKTIPSHINSRNQAWKLLKRHAHTSSCFIRRNVPLKFGV